jgi:hypothetical protein
MEIPITKSRWKAAQIDQKTVEFRVPLENQGPVEGCGVFWATPCPDDRLSISIVVHLRWGNASATQIRIPVPQGGVDRIEEHPDQTVARYRLLV